MAAKLSDAQVRIKMQNLHPSNHVLPQWINGWVDRSRTKPSESLTFTVPVNDCIVSAVESEITASQSPSRLNQLDVIEEEGTTKYWNHDRLKIVTMPDDSEEHQQTKEDRYKDVRKALEGASIHRNTIANIGAATIARASAEAAELNFAEFENTLNEAARELAVAMGQSLQTVSDIMQSAFAETQKEVSEAMERGILTQSKIFSMTCVSADLNCGVPFDWMPTEPKKSKSIVDAVITRAKRGKGKSSEFVEKIKPLTSLIEGIRVLEQDDAVEICDGFLISEKHICDQCVQQARVHAIQKYFETGADPLFFPIDQEEDELDIFSVSAVAKVSMLVKYAVMISEGEIK